MWWIWLEGDEDDGPEVGVVSGAADTRYSAGGLAVDAIAGPMASKLRRLRVVAKPQREHVAVADTRTMASHHPSSKPSSAITEPRRDVGIPGSAGSRCATGSSSWSLPTAACGSTASVTMIWLYRLCRMLGTKPRPYRTACPSVQARQCQSRDRFRSRRYRRRRDR